MVRGGYQSENKYNEQNQREIYSEYDDMHSLEDYSNTDEIM